MNPQPEWDDLSSYYSEDYPPYAPSGQASVSDETLTELARQTGMLRHIPIPEGKRLLDVGCGGGAFLRAAKTLGASVMGVEPGESGAARARSSGLEVFAGTLEQFAEMNAGRERFDIITCCHVLEHTPQPVQTLATMKTLLQPNGFVWIAVPNAGCLFARTLGWRWHSTDLPYHLVQFTPQSLHRAVESAGLVVSACSTDSPTSGVASSIRTMLRYRCMIPSRLSGRLLPERAVEWLARALDRRLAGEAILVELRPGSTLDPLGRARSGSSEELR
jgi:SAM-dependent methyltransferase